MSQTSVGTNQALVGQAFGILRDGLVPYVCRELQIAYGDSWWSEGALRALDNTKDLPRFGSWEKTTGSLDIAAALRLFTGEYWGPIMSKKVPRDARTWAMELKSTRNRWAHLGAEDFSDDDTWRALDTMHRLAECIDPEGAQEIAELLRSFRYQDEKNHQPPAADMEVPEGTGIARQQRAGIMSVVPSEGLKSWREVMKPHPDVAQGLYKTAEFAADLDLVAQGKASAEYQDPREFFARTYVTGGMQGLLEQALRRVAGKEGEPVIQLKTAQSEA